MVNDVAVEVTGLEKSYGRTRVLCGVDLWVSPGSVFCLLGPNGAGKTTTVRILATLTRADAGHARVAGFDVVRERRQVRRAISLTGQYAAVDETQTGEENLRMMARLVGARRRTARARARELLERFGLTEAGSRLVKTYSGGMRRRLDLAASLIGNPAVIFLDEPTTGLDVRSRQAMWEVIAELTDSGVTIVLTTQYLEEADRLADRVAVIDAGRIVADGTPIELKQRVADQRLELRASDAAAFQGIDRALDGRAVYRDPGELVLGTPIDGTARGVRELLDELDPDRTMIHDFGIHTATLDDVFLALTGHSARSDDEAVPGANAVTPVSVERKPTDAATGKEIAGV